MTLSPSPSSDELPPFAPRRIGRVRLESRLGKGGIGEVFRGWDERLKRPVAVKVLSDRFASDSRAVGRFMREARLLSRMDHPSICRVYDWLEEKGQQFLVLELIEGVTLRQYVDRQQPDEAEVLRIAEQVLAAVAAAHERGIVHRDLKPENIMITPEGRVKVLDFGLARRFRLLPASGQFEAVESGSWEEWQTPSDSVPGSAATQGQLDGDATERFPRSRSGVGRTTFLTDAGETFGTLTYMSPEQVMQEPVTPKSDLYSFGIILQELVTGKRAYPKLDMLHLLDRVQKAQVLPVEDADPDLADLLEELLDRRPDRRPSSKKALARVRWLVSRPERRRRRQRQWIGAALVATLALLAAGLTAYVTHRRSVEAHETARRFARAASDLQWQLREERRAPLHDLRPARAEVRQRMENLRQQMEGLAPQARGPAEAALGQAALAMGESELGRQYLERAWQRGHRPAEAAVGLGLAIFERYRRELATVDGLGDERSRERRRAALNARWRDPALAHLEAARRELEARPEGFVPRTAGESLAYVEALIAFYDGRYDQTLDQARRAIDQLPWLHEALLLEGRVHRMLGDRQDTTATSIAFEGAYRRAERAFLAAAEIGRSDPVVHLALCDLAVGWIRHRTYGPGTEIASLFERGMAACDRARTLDADDPRPWRMITELRMRRAEAAGDDDVKLSLLRRAERSAEQALAREARPDIDPGSAWRSLGHVYSVEVDWLVYQRNEAVPDNLFAQLVLAYRMASRLSPGDPEAHNAVGNANSLLAAARHRAGEPADRALERSIRAYQRALELDEDIGVSINLASVLELRARRRLDRGLPVLTEVREAVVKIDRVLASDPEKPVAWTTRALLFALAADTSQRAGADPGPHLKALETSLRRTLELAPYEEPFLRPARARATLVRLAMERARSRAADSEWSPSPQRLDEIRAQIEGVREQDPHQADVYRDRLETLLGSAPAPPDPGPPVDP